MTDANGAGNALRRDRRGVSEVVGFVLVFGLILTSVGIVYAVGQEGLQGARDFERVNNAERAFDVLADNVDDVAHEGAPSRATELKLADARLSVGDPVVVNVTAGHHDTPSRNVSTEYELRPLVYEAGEGSQVVYANGAVLRGEREGAVVVRRPDLLLSKERVVVPVVATRAGRDGGTNVAGTTTVLVRTERASQRVVATRTDGPYDVNLTVTTPRARAWERYLELETPDADDCTVSGDAVSCELSGVQRVYVTAVELDVTIE